MPRKLRCPQCGAKNATDHARCRICGGLLREEIDLTTTDIIDLTQGSAAAEPIERVVAARTHGTAPPPLNPAEHFDPAEFELPWSARPLPPPPTRDNPVVRDVEPFDPSELVVERPADPRPSSGS
jgi:hypothetical protein